MSKLKYSNQTAGEKELTIMKYRDLKIACIVRGMHFEDIVEGTVPALQYYFIKNYDVKQDKALLERYVDWMAELLINKGHAVDSPLVKYRLTTCLDEENESKINRSLKKSHVKKEKKAKRQRDDKFNIFKGTKKALTFQCALDGLTIQETITKVMAQFPDAQEKSIKIWTKTALRKK